MRQWHGTRQKYYAIFMSLLLLFSLFTPSLAFAEKQDGVQLNTLEEDLELERQLEEEIPISNEEFEMIEGLPKITDGIDATHPTIQDEANEEEQFVLNGKVEQTIIDGLAKDDTVNVIIHMKEIGDKSSLFQTAKTITNRVERIELVQNELKRVAETSQTKVMHELNVFEKEGLVDNIQPLWIINGIAAEVTEKALNELYVREDVEKIVHDQIYEVPEITNNGTAPRLPEWGLEKIFAPKVWGEYGIDGSGIVVGIMDTGVEGTHEALAHNYRGKDGDHSASWADFSTEGYTTPQDGHGHGTHVAGTAVGGGEGEPVGVAPGASWIAAKIFNDRGSATESGIHQAFEWFLAPGGDPNNAPHIVNNSWGNSNTYTTRFVENVQAWVAAGIFPLFAAGNDGPGGTTVGAPASYPESFSVGATDINDQIASFSSRGPVVWDGERYLKPEVSAPGHQIYSAWPGNNYNTISGTSMATPHVAGTLALLLQADPDLTIDDLKQSLTNTTRTAPHMGQLPNDVYGHGIINAYQAVTEASFAGTVQGSLVDQDGNPIAGEIFIESEDIEIYVPEDGIFEFKMREGTHEVTVQSFGYYTDKLTLTVVKGEVTEVAWQLDEAERYNLSGTVTKEDGSPAAFAYVRLQNTPLKTVRTDQNGQFDFGKVPEGSYHLSVAGKNLHGKQETISIHEDLQLDVTVLGWTSLSGSNWDTVNNHPHRNAISDEDISAEDLIEMASIGTSGNTVFSSPVVNEHTIVVTTDQGRIHAIDRDTHEVRWTYRTGIFNRGTATIADDVVYVTGGQDGKVYALDIMTGAVIWDTIVGNAVLYETPLYEDGILYLSSSVGGHTNVVALDAHTGSSIWSKTLKGASYFGASIAGDDLFIGTYDGRTLYSLSKHDGNENWTFTVNGEGFATHPVIVDDTIYAVSTNMDRNTGTLWAINEVGEEIWHVGDIGDTQAASPVIYEDIVIMSSATNPVLKAFDRHNGTTLWENKNINTALNNGAVSSNGLYFITNSLGTLSAVDVFQGDIVAQWNLNGPSSSTPAIVSGELIVSTHSGIMIFEAPSYLVGKIQDINGDPVEGFAHLTGTNIRVEADEKGHFELTTKPGQYEVKVGKYGLEQVIETLDFHSGYTFEKTYTLAQVEAGQLSGTIFDKRSEASLGNVTVTVLDTPLEAATDQNGDFKFADISAGSYDLLIQASGFVDQIVPVIITAHEEAEVTVELDPIDVAVLSDYEGTITNLLNRTGISAEEQQWETIVAEIASYAVVYLNGAYRSGGWQPTKEDVEALIDAAKVHNVSLIFADTWGPNYGSIGHLTDFYNDPKVLQGDYNNSNVTIIVDEVHPIFEGYNIGDEIRVINNGSISWFNEYSGNELATIGNNRLGNVGTGIAYKAVTQDSAHLLLSTHATASWNLPTQHWLHDQHKILINGVNYLLDELEFGQVTGQVVDTDGNPLQVKVEVKETGVYAETNEDGAFEVFHDEGLYELEIRLPGYETKTVEVNFEHGEVSSETIEMIESADGQLSGIVTDKNSSRPVQGVEVSVLNESGELIQTVTTSSQGVYELNELRAEKYTIEFSHNDYVFHTEQIEMTGEAIALDIELTPAPYVAIVGDRTSGLTIRSILEEVNIQSNNFTSIETLVEQMEEYDVVFYNNLSGLKKDELERFEEVADEHGVSLIYGDSYFSGSGIKTLVNLRENPASVRDLNIRTSSAQYKVHESHPVFGDAKAGEAIDILTPSGSRVTTFSDYTGFVLADIKHAEQTDSHGPGVAFMPRTNNSLELLMSGHNNGIGHYADDYTDAGIDMFRNAVIWAANEQFNVIQGVVTNEHGELLEAEVTFEINDVEFIDQVSSEDGRFKRATIDGQATLSVSAFGYETEVIDIDVSDELEPLEIQLSLKETVGHVEGIITNKMSMEGIQGARIDIIGFPREGESNTQGRYHIDNLESGTYDVIISADDFVREEVTIEIDQEGTTTLDVQLRPSPTIGIIVDSQSSSAKPLSEYLEDRGFKTISMFYDDVDQLAEVDLVFANSAYNNNLIPDEQTFKQFLRELDESKTSVIWTGQHGSQGSIRYLIDYIGDPAIEYRGSGAGTKTATIIEDHPIFDGVDETFEFTTQSNYYYGFDGYSGTILADYEHSNIDDVGKMVGFKGRTTNSVEILLSGMTVGHGFHEGNVNFDKNREQILYNSILWAIDHEGSYAGELRGQVENDRDQAVMAKVTVEETGYVIQTDPDGTFFLDLSEGEYTLHIDAFGHVQQTFTITVENGEIISETFRLQSESVGEVIGYVDSLTTGDAVPGAKIEILGTPNHTVTDERGNFSLILPEGTFTARITAEGYQPQTVELNVKSDEVVHIDVSLSDTEAIALIASSVNHNRLGSFLESNSYEVETFDRNEHSVVKDRINEFSLVIFNDSGLSMTESEFNELIDAADEAQVSMVFSSMYTGGSIEHLKQFLGDPEVTSSGYVPNEIRYEVIEEHPIFTGFNVGDSFTLLDRSGSNQQYGVFERYSGTTLADVTDENEERIGGGLAYDFRSSNHVHLLLGSLSSSTYGHPEDRWTDNARMIYLNAIDWAMNASQGEIYGAVTDNEGNPIQGARVVVEESRNTVMTNEEGEYTLGVGSGSYTLSVRAVGFEPTEMVVQVDQVGEAVEQNFVLEKSEQMSLYGSVTKGATGEVFPEVLVEVRSLNGELIHTTTTDEQGQYVVANLLKGSYEVTFSKEGYHSVMRDLMIDDEDVELNVSISSYHIAVLGDYKGALSELLTEYDLPAEQVDWNVINYIENYDVIIVNESKGSLDDIESLITASDDHEISLVFLDTWGIQNGSIHLLEQALGYPNKNEHGYNEGEVSINVNDPEHPIFADFDTEEKIKILTERSPYATFDNYEGTVIADLSVGTDEKGASIGYEFRSDGHVHLLLSAFAVNNMIGPKQGWTEEGKQLFVQAVDWARMAKMELPTAPTWKNEKERFNIDNIVIEGMADPGVTVRILEKEKLLAEVIADENGNFTVNLDLDLGAHKLYAEAVNMVGTVRSETEMHVIVVPRAAQPGIPPGKKKGLN